MYLKQFQNLRIMASKLTHIINSVHIIKNNKQIYFWFIWYDIRHQYIPLIMFLQHNKVQKWVLHVTDNYEFKYNLQFLFQKTLFLALKLITSGIVKMFFNIKKNELPNHHPFLFQAFWNVFELVILAVSYAIGLMFIWRAVLCVQVLNRISENPTSFVNMHFTVMLDDVSNGHLFNAQFNKK